MSVTIGSVVEMTPANAKVIFCRINKTAGDLADLLWEAHQGQAWKALGYSSWNQCVNAECDFTKRRANQLIAFVEVKEQVGTAVPTLPTSERQTRPLTKLDPEQQPAAWEKAVEIAGGEQPTAKQVEQAVTEVTVKAGAPVHNNRPAPIIIDAAERIWATAKATLDTIIPQDISREKALRGMIEYCLNRLHESTRAKRGAYTPDNGIQYAQMGIDSLAKIHPNDSQRTLAFDQVIAWIENQRKGGSK